MPIPLKRIANTQDSVRTQMMLLQEQNVRDPLKARGFELLTEVLPFHHAFASNNSKNMKPRVILLRGED